MFVLSMLVESFVCVCDMQRNSAMLLVELSAWESHLSMMVGLS